MAIDTVVEEVADNLEEIASATRQINTTHIAYFAAGAAFGVALGFYWGWRYKKEAIKAQAFKESEAEVAEIRENYQKKVVAAEPKPDISDLMKERGYTEVEVEDNPGAANVRPLPPPVPVYEPPRVFERDRNTGWNYERELESRVPGEPYVIHQDEWSENVNEYAKVVYTWYDGDEVLTDEDNSVLPITVVGPDNLRFGHGTDDADVVFIRNERLQIDIELCRTPDRYDEEVLGLTHDEPTDEPDDD